MDLNGSKLAGGQALETGCIRISAWGLKLRKQTVGSFHWSFDPSKTWVTQKSIHPSNDRTVSGCCKFVEHLSHIQLYIPFLANIDQPVFHGMGRAIFVRFAGRHLNAMLPSAKMGHRYHIVIQHISIIYI